MPFICRRALQPPSPDQSMVTTSSTTRPPAPQSSGLPAARRACSTSTPRSVSRAPPDPLPRVCSPPTPSTPSSHRSSTFPGRSARKLCKLSAFARFIICSCPFNVLTLVPFTVNKCNCHLSPQTDMKVGGLLAGRWICRGRRKGCRSSRFRCPSGKAGEKMSVGESSPVVDHTRSDRSLPKQSYATLLRENLSTFLFRDDPCSGTLHYILPVNALCDTPAIKPSSCPPDACPTHGS